MLLENQGRVRHKTIAEALGVSERTLRAWKKTAAKFLAEPRSANNKAIRFCVLLKAAREWKKQGYPGSRPVSAALPNVPVRVVRSAIAKLKERRRKRADQKRRAHRVSVRVKHPGTVVTVDGATIRKGEDHIVSRDRANLSVQTRPCVNGALSALDTLAVLNNLKVQNRLPFVYCSDNGSPLCANVVSEFLNKNYIVHLKSLPRTPQHNGACENAVREWKELLKEGLSPSKATEVLNEHRKRRSLGYKTSLEFDRENYRGYTKQDRKKFFETTKTAIELAMLGTKSGTEKRKRERAAILQCMENFSLIQIIRSGQLRPKTPEETL